MARGITVETGRAFVNPYNFVPFASFQPDRKKIDEWRGELTGVIECELTVQTPLAIPDSAQKKSDKEEPKHFRYPFMRRIPGDDASAFIPGSELRGMIRAVYEAATDSCMSILEDKKLTGRSSEFARECGLIRKEGGQWYLYKSSNILLPSFNTGDRKFSQGSDQNGMYIEDTVSNKRYRQGERVSFEYRVKESETPRGKIQQKIVTQLGTGANEGYLLIAEKGLNASGIKGHKYSHIILIPKNGAEKIQLAHGEIDDLSEVLRYYQDDKLNNAFKKNDGTHFGYKGLKVSENDFTPVFCHRIGERYLLSPAMQGREVYGSSLTDFVGGYTPCLAEKGQDCVCPACALFGKIGKDCSYGGRVRFTDADVMKMPEFEKDVTLNELSSPKVSTTEFYTEIDRKDGNPKEWNYLYQKSVNPTTGKNQLSLLKGNQLFLRGRKFYLHQSKPEYLGREKTERNSTVEIAKSGSFRFKVYFENLSDWELNRLIWCLKPYRKIQDREEILYHKLGHGRPLGLGSVRINLISDVMLRSVSVDGNGKVSYSVKTFDYQKEQTEARIPEALKNILSFAVSDVHYPKGIDRTVASDSKNAGASHQWFMMNRSMQGTGNDHNVKYVLPYLPVTGKTAEELGTALRLPELEKRPDDASQMGCGVVDMKYQKPQKSPWRGARPIQSEQYRESVKDNQVVTIQKGAYYTVTLIRIVPEKKDLYCKMPDGLEGYVRVFNRDISAYKVGQAISVVALDKDLVRNNWKIKLV